MNKTFYGITVGVRRLVNTIRIRGTVPYIVIIIVGTLVCLPVVRNGLSNGHDVIFHAYRAASTAHAIKDDQLVPQVDPNALGGFGYSWNMFYGPLSSYICSLFRVFTPSWSIAINLFILMSVIASGIFIYKLVFEITDKKMPSLFSSFIYMAAPYHLLDICSRRAAPICICPDPFHGALPDSDHEEKWCMVRWYWSGRLDTIT